METKKNFKTSRNLFSGLHLSSHITCGPVNLIRQSLYGDYPSKLHNLPKVQVTLPLLLVRADKVDHQVQDLEKSENKYRRSCEKDH
jgi:hypothetical protein